MAVLLQENDSAKFFLYSVNVLLQSIGELSITTEADILQVIEAQQAAEILEETKQAVLADGWEVNFDADYTFPPDTSGFINVPANVLDISSKDSNLIIRDWKLYDKKNQTSIFEEAKKVDVYWNLDFNTLTHPLRYYITMRAARVFQARTIMDTNVYGFTQNDEDLAYSAARRSETRNTQGNMLDGTVYGSQYDVRGGL